MTIKIINIGQFLILMELIVEFQRLNYCKSNKDFFDSHFDFPLGVNFLTIYETIGGHWLLNILIRNQLKTIIGRKEKEKIDH